MIDFHTHILPSVDDGSKSIAESIALLSMLKEQGVDTVLATPHFRPDKDSVDSFLERRDEAYSRFISELPPDMPKVLLGAEVGYYEGISNLEGLERLTLNGSNLLLLEMPMRRWSEFMIGEIVELMTVNGFDVILAHAERYEKFAKEDVITYLLEQGVYIQVNASFFTIRFMRGRAFKWLKKSMFHCIGTDCHNLQSRPPRMREALDIIKKKTGKEFSTNKKILSKLERKQTT
ncbi:MAG: capsular polysaccharide biosynthesis protein [Clostridia bacterium]|nr:capsular polysaccharide biosynthesis protein [Clostridia bacterium]